VLTVLAHGPWSADRVTSRWLGEHYRYGEAAQAEATRALQRLADRGSPSHEGVSARLASWTATDGALELELQPAPWSSRLLEGDKHGACAVVCVVRADDGRFLAGRRAPWLAIWPDVWMLGGAGGIDLGEDVTAALSREVREEWRAEPVGPPSIEAIVQLPDGMLWIVGQAWLAPGTKIVADEEHAAWAWWPADHRRWPEETRRELRDLAALLS
jgi:8-oxo-dGTP diphosphatase